MSLYEEESGTVVVPELDWPYVYGAVVRAWNAWQDERLLQARRLRTELAARYGGQGDVALWREEVERLAHRAAAHERAIYGGDEVNWREMAVVAARNALLGQIRDGGDLFPSEPGCNWFPHARQEEECFDLGGASLAMSRASYTLTWSVHRGDRACTKARVHPVGAALFQALSRVLFARGTGGFVGRKDGSHGRQSYPVTTFGSDERHPALVSGTAPGGRAAVMPG